MSVQTKLRERKFGHNMIGELKWRELPAPAGRREMRQMREQDAPATFCRRSEGANQRKKEK
jgi:hypothetical protein